VSHTEYVADVDYAGSDPTVTTTYAVNPQRTATFPWLFALATRFEMFRFRKLKFHYRPSCGTATDGFVCLGFDFDYYDSQPIKSSMLTWKYSAKSACWQSVSLDVSNDSRLATMRYCNYDSSNGDARLDMLGNFFMMSSSNASKSLGELFIEYEIEFRQPAYKIPSALYQKMEGAPASNSAQLFNNVISNVGNMLCEHIPASNSFLIKDVCKLFVSLTQFGSGITSDPIIAVTTPVGNPSAESTWTQTFASHNSGGGTRQGVLDVKVPPVILSFSNSSGNAGSQQGFVRMGTYAVYPNA